MESTLSHAHTQLLTREHLAAPPVPPATRTHVPVPHHEVIQALTETLGFRHIGIVREQYAIDRTGMKMFGALDLETTFAVGCRFSIGIRNVNDKSMRLALTVGYRLWSAHHKRYYPQ